MTEDVENRNNRPWILSSIFSGIIASVLMGVIAYSLPVPELGSYGVTFFSAIAAYIGITGVTGMTFGWVLHIIAGIIMGLIFAAVTLRVRAFRISDPMNASILGLVYGIIIWAVFFTPLMYFPWTYLSAYPMFFVGGLGLHMAFGLVLGASFWALAFRRSSSVSREIQPS